MRGGPGMNVEDSLGQVLIERRWEIGYKAGLQMAENPQSLPDTPAGRCLRDALERPRRGVLAMYRDGLVWSRWWSIVERQRRWLGGGSENMRRRVAISRGNYPPNNPVWEIITEVLQSLVRQSRRPWHASRFLLIVRKRRRTEPPSSDIFSLRFTPILWVYT